MKPKALLIIISVSTAATLWSVMTFLFGPKVSGIHLLLWTFTCFMGEFFHVRNLSDDSSGSLGGTARLTTVCMLGPMMGVVPILLGTLLGSLILQRQQWFKAIYNASQLTLASAVGAAVYSLLGGPVLIEMEESSGSVLGALSDWRFLAPFLMAGFTYFVINNGLMAWLMSALTDQKVSRLWRQYVLYPEGLTSTAGLVLMCPLFILLYGSMGIWGLLILMACLGLLRVADGLFITLAQARDSLVLQTRMGAMGEMAEQIGVTLGGYSDELQDRTHNITSWTDLDQSKSFQKNAGILSVNVNRMTSLISVLREFTNLEPQFEKVNLAQVVEDAIEFVRPNQRFQGVRFSFVPANVPLISADASHLQQALVNLFNNASDAMRDAKTPDRSITVSLKTEGKSIQIMVTDSGPGIPESVLPTMFEPGRSEKSDGHGYGLAVVFRVMENHGGTVTAYNVPDVGAEICMTFPTG